MNDLKQLLANYTNALNGFDLKSVEAMFAPEAIYISPGLNGEISGRENIMAAFRQYFAEHPDQVNSDSSVNTHGPNMLHSCWHLRATNIKSGQQVARSGHQHITFNAAGKIERIEVHDD